MNDSYIQVCAQLAHRRALLKLEEIKQLRATEWKNRIIEEQARRGRARLWMPWLKCLTEQDARKRILEESVNFGRWSPDCIQWERYERCERVLSLARTVIDDELATPVVFLSSEDLDYIS